VALGQQDDVRDQGAGSLQVHQLAAVRAVGDVDRAVGVDPDGQVRRSGLQCPAERPGQVLGHQPAGREGHALDGGVGCCPTSRSLPPGLMTPAVILRIVHCLGQETDQVVDEGGVKLTEMVLNRRRGD
jgi:hypothetical protein